MSKETDAIIAVHKASGAPGVVTDINTPGEHTPWAPAKGKHGNHYRPATPSQSGAIGVAVDFGGKGRRLTDRESLEVFEAFRPYGERGELSELYCSQARHCVYQGRWQRWTDVPRPSRDIIRSNHYNHIHVAGYAGRFLVPPQQPTVEEDNEMVQYEWTDGAIIQMNAKGEVFCPKIPGRPIAKHFGGMPQLKDEHKRSFSGKATVIVGADWNNSQAGYIILDESWGFDDFWKFEPGVEKLFK